MNILRLPDNICGYFCLVSVSILILCFGWFLGYNQFFFWDTVQLSSKQAHYFYEQADFNLLLPEDIDSGHFPFMGMYLSVWWKAFGKSLFTSHLAMLPWVIGLAFAITSILQYFIPAGYRLLSVIILSIDPTLLSQISLVSPDVILISSLCLAIAAYLKKNRYSPAIWMLCLSLISLRGLMVSAALITSILIWHMTRKEMTEAKKWSRLFLPAVVANTIYLLYHWMAKDWIGFHGNSPWSPSFQRVTAEGFFRNALLFTWRMVDFGKIALVLCSGIILLKGQIKRESGILWVALLSVITGSVLFIVTTGFQSLTAHRYYLPLYVFLSLLFCILLFHSAFTEKMKISLSLFVIAVLLSGNFWIYPAGVSQGWDSSLAHRPIFRLYTETEQFLGKHSIPKKDVGTFFPFLSEEKYISLREDTLKFSPAESPNTPYVFLSNVMNDIPDEWFARYTPEKALFYKKQGGVWAGIFPRQ